MTPWIVARQAPLSMGCSWQEYWSELPFLFQGIFQIQGLKQCFLHWQMASFTTQPPGKPIKDGEGDGIVVYHFLQLHVNLQLFQDEKIWDFLGSQFSG